MQIVLILAQMQNKSVENTNILSTVG